jgi:hypothetical protein
MLLLSISVLAGGTISVNAGTTLNASISPEAGRLVIRGILSDSVISLANAPSRDPRYSIQLINTPAGPLVGSVISIGTAAVPAPNTFFLLLGVLALGLGKRFRRSI